MTLVLIYVIYDVSVSFFLAHPVYNHDWLCTNKYRGSIPGSIVYVVSEKTALVLQCPCLYTLIHFIFLMQGHLRYIYVFVDVIVWCI